MTPNAPLKLAVRAAIKAGGGIKNAAHVCSVSESQAGRWNALTHHDLPLREYCHLLDELALAETGRAPIVEEMARQLGHVAFCLPEASGSDGHITETFAEVAAEFGEIAKAIVTGGADGGFDVADRSRIAAEIHDAQRVLAKLLALVVDDERAKVINQFNDAVHASRLQPLAGE